MGNGLIPNEVIPKVHDNIVVFGYLTQCQAQPGHFVIHTPLSLLNAAL